MAKYRIKNWSANFENNRSKEVKNLTYVPTPNKHDGEGYTILMTEHEQGYAHYAAWLLMVQVASKCEPRGVLCRDDGTPLDARALALKTRAPRFIFEDAIPRLLEIGWLEVCDDTAGGCGNVAGGCDDIAEGCDDIAEGCDVPPILGKGREGKGRGEERASARETPPSSPSASTGPEPDQDIAGTVLAEYRAVANELGIVVATSAADSGDAKAIGEALPAEDDRRDVFRAALGPGAFRGPLRYIRQDLAKWWEDVEAERSRRARELDICETRQREPTEPPADPSKVDEMLARLPWRRG